MQTLLANFDGQFPNTYQLRFPYEGQNFDYGTYSGIEDWYSSCVNNFFRSSSAIERFTHVERPDNIEERYLIIWGVMQALIIQTDAVKNLYKIFGHERWIFPPITKELRDLRNETGGHPTQKDHKSSSLVVELYSGDWGVTVFYKNKPVRAQTFILERLEMYEAELVAALQPIYREIQSRIELPG